MVRLLGLTALLAGLIFIMERIAPEWIHPLRWMLLLFFGGLSLIAHQIVQFGLRKHPGNILVYYLGMMLTRMMVSLAFISVLIFRNTPDVVTLVINFFVLYLLYAGFEIYWLLGNLRRNSTQAHKP